MITRFIVPTLSGTYDDAPLAIVVSVVVFVVVDVVVVLVVVVEVTSGK
jgi:ABC-type enterochelin transport system permease subunit